MKTSKGDAQFNAKYKQAMEYMGKTFGLRKLVAEFDVRRPYKQTNDADVLVGMLSGLMGGVDSLDRLAEFTDRSRSVLEGLLKLDGLARRLRRYVAAMIKKMKRGKMIVLPHVGGKLLGSVDGVETHRKMYSPEDFYKAVRSGLVGPHCQVSVHRSKKTGLIERYEVYHRLVVVCLITDRGPMPFSWGYQLSELGTAYATWLEGGADPAKHPASESSKDKAKQEGELTVLKQLLVQMKAAFGGKVPFDILVGDGLYDKAPILEEVERHGAILIAVHNNERRCLHQDAEQDFSTRVPDRTWVDGDRSCQGWAGVFSDPNLTCGGRKVKIVRVIRCENDVEVDNYFYCSNQSWVTPRLVEWCRFYRWKEENGLAIFAQPLEKVKLACTNFLALAV